MKCSLITPSSQVERVDWDDGGGCVTQSGDWCFPSQPTYSMSWRDDIVLAAMPLLPQNGFRIIGTKTTNWPTDYVHEYWWYNNIQQILQTQSGPLQNSITNHKNHVQSVDFSSQSSFRSHVPWHQQKRGSRGSFAKKGWTNWANRQKPKHPNNQTKIVHQFS